MRNTKGAHNGRIDQPVNYEGDGKEVNHIEGKIGMDPHLQLKYQDKVEIVIHHHPIHKVKMN